MPEKSNMDQIDCHILEELQKSGRLSIVELAARVNLTKTPCAERVRRLERRGVLTGYHAVVRPEAVGMTHVTIVHISLDQNSGRCQAEFNDAVRKIPEVQSCLLIAGHFDYMLKVRTQDMAHFREVLGEQISKLPHVQQTHSFAVMETVKDDNRIVMATAGCS